MSRSLKKGPFVDGYLLKKAETARYYSTKSILGANKVRGAGHTKPFAGK